MPSFEDLHIQPTVAEELTQRGWSADAPAVRDAAPTAARGHNLVAVAPPMPVYATPALAGLFSRLQPGRSALLIVPPVQLGEWGALAQALAQKSDLRVQVARGAARSMRRLREEGLEVMVAPLETALALLTRSALRMESVDAVLLAWPELLRDEDAMVPLMQDLPREAQRIVYTSDASRVNRLIDRYARKALTIGPTAPEQPAAGLVRTISTSWSGRVEALAEAVELLDPASLVIWTADRSHHEEIRRAVPDEQSRVQLVVDESPTANTIVAFDLPPRERLDHLLKSGEVVLLVPPGTENYASQLASSLRPLQLPGPVDAARSAEQVQRDTIQRRIDQSKQSGSLLTLAPLFERHDARVVAAALFDLWQGSGPPPAEPAPVPAATAKVYVGAGKKDGVNANDLVAVLTKELRVDRTRIGRIELRDTYSLIELPASDAEQLAGRLNGTTIRRKRVTARVDRGPNRPGRSDAEPRRPIRRTNRP